MPSAVSSVSIDVSGTFMGIFLSGFICAALWGMAVAQVYFYFRRYPDDSSWMKLFVLWVLALETAAEILVIKGLARPLLFNWGNPASPTAVVPEFIWQILTTCLLSCSAQLFFTYRLWIYSGKKFYYPLFFIPAALSQIVAGIIYIEGTLNTDGNDSKLHRISFERTAIAANSIAVGVDLLIAILMGYRLLTSRSEFARTDRMINTLFILTVNSGLWTAIVAVVSLVASLRTPPLDFAAVYVMLSPLYCNTVLANLNVRAYVRNQGKTTGTFILSSLSRRQPPKASNLKNFPHPESTAHSVGFGGAEAQTGISHSSTITHLGCEGEQSLEFLKANELQSKC